MAAALPLFLTACDDDDISGGSETTELTEFPQGTNSYDNEFVEFFNTYGTQTLYKFTDADFRWAVTSNIAYYAEQADESKVAKAWSVICDNGLKAWPDDFLKKVLPYRILLASKIWYTANGSWNSETSKYDKVNVYVNSVYGYNHIAFATDKYGADDLTAEEKRQLVGDVAYALVGYAVSKGLISIPTEYQTLFDTWKNNFGENMGHLDEWSPCCTYGYNAAGCLEGMPYNDYSVYREFALYVKYMTMMTDEDFQTNYLNDSFDCGGIVDWSTYTATDSHPIKQKYEVVKSYFKDELGIDLSAIGAKTAQIE